MSSDYCITTGGNYLTEQCATRLVLEDQIKAQAAVIDSAEKVYRKYSWHLPTCDYQNFPNLQDDCKCEYRQKWDELSALYRALKEKYG